MTKTPYEIRLELLKLSKDILSERFYNNREAVQRQYESDQDNWQKNYAIGKIEDRIEYPTTQYNVNHKNVVALATQLNDFISNG
jgi:uncharacterized protein YllA (UPF0747 family)